MDPWTQDPCSSAAPAHQPAGTRFYYCTRIGFVDCYKMARLSDDFNDFFFQKENLEKLQEHLNITEDDVQAALNTEEVDNEFVASAIGVDENGINLFVFSLIMF